jgi:hypothetical protein
MIYDMWLWCSPDVFMQASYLYTSSLLRGITFAVLPMSSYALSPTMLPLLETFCELLSWNSFQCCRHIFPLIESALWTGAVSIRWAKVEAFFHVIDSIIPHSKFIWPFGRVERIQSEQSPWYRRNWQVFSSFVISTCELPWVMGMSAVYVSNFVVCFRDNIERIVFHLQW